MTEQLFITLLMWRAVGLIFILPVIYRQMNKLIYYRAVDREVEFKRWVLLAMTVTFAIATIIPLGVDVAMLLDTHIPDWVAPMYMCTWALAGVPLAIGFFIIYLEGKSK